MSCQELRIILGEYFFYLFMAYPEFNRGFSYLQRKMSCYERNAYAWKERVSLLWDISIDTGHEW